MNYQRGAFVNLKTVPDEEAALDEASILAETNALLGPGTGLEEGGEGGNPPPLENPTQPSPTASNRTNRVNKSGDHPDEIAEYVATLEEELALAQRELTEIAETQRDELTGNQSRYLVPRFLRDTTPMTGFNRRAFDPTITPQARGTGR